MPSEANQTDPKPCQPTSSAELAKKAADFYNETGMYRAVDLWRLLGDPTQGVAVGLSNQANVSTQHSDPDS